MICFSLWFWLWCAFYNRSLNKHIILLSKCTSRLTNKRIHIKLVSSELKIIIMKQNARRGVIFTKIVRGCARRISTDFLYSNFSPNFPPISIPFSKEKHPILTKLDAFNYDLPKLHPICAIWGPSSLMKTPDRYTKFHEKALQKAGTYTYTVSMRGPPQQNPMKEWEQITKEYTWCMKANTGNILHVNGNYTRQN